MSNDATLTSKGQTTIPKAIRDGLSMKAGDRMTFTLMPDATVVMRVKKKSVSCQDSCHLFQAAFFRRTESSRTGLSHMTTGRTQLRVAPDQRSGWACLACA